jgi:hypothetical protein
MSISSLEGTDLSMIQKALNIFLWIININYVFVFVENVELLIVQYISALSSLFANSRNFQV